MTGDQVDHDIRDPLLRRLGEAPHQPPFASDPFATPPNPTAHRLAPAKPQPRAATPPAGKGSRKRHPAKGARVGALAVSCAATGGLALWFADANASGASGLTLAGASGSIATVAPTDTSAASPSVSAATTPATTPAGTQNTTSTSAATTTTVAAAIQTFDGAVVNTRYGPVQVQAQITAGVLTDVAIVQYPDNDGKSIRINERALPELRSASLEAQTADVDTVSGATYTSDGYIRSLQSAIDQARAAGVTNLA